MQTPLSMRWRDAFLAAVLIGATTVSSLALAQDPPHEGEAIYRQHCAHCHGATGEGTEDNPKPLIGDRPVADLAKVIHDTMPEDDPEAVVDEDAKKVAAYIHEAFYSPLAQARVRPPRVELSRLTVRQYQNTLADVIGAFSSTAVWGEERGLRGRYYNERRMGRNSQIERVDPRVSFQFGEASPDPDKVKPEEFSIRWEGSVLAPDTGEYELIVKTENSARLWLNDDARPLIDAWVKSGDDTEYRASVFLLGGRIYPLRLEFSKSKQQKTSSIGLEWKPPHRVGEVIPPRYLSPQRAPEVFVVQTAFPPDDRSVGYERGSAVSKEWDQATTYAAVEAAGYVAARVNNLAGVRQDSEDRLPRIKDFCRKFVERAFRRPLSDEQRQSYVERHFEGADEELAIKKVVLLALKSPRFLYREIGAGDAYDAASRLSFTLWDSIPDQKLLEAAAAGQLSTPEQLRAHAERMILDLRTRSKTREFLHQWLKVEHMDNVAKDRELFPEFDEHVVSDLRTSLDLFLDDIIWSETSDFRKLLLTESLFLNGRLAKYYGADLPPDAEFQKVSFDPQQRAGVLSHPFLLTGFAYHSTSSPIHRGVFVSRSLLGRTLRPPPVAVAPLSPDLHAGLTTRERVILQTSPNLCNSCHAMINPLGFPMEQYDAIGRYRNEEYGKPVDTTGSYLTLSGTMVEFDGVRQLADFLAGSEEAHQAFVAQVFHHFVKQPVRAFPGHPETLRQAFAANNFHVQKLLIDVAVTAASPTPSTP